MKQLKKNDFVFGIRAIMEAIKSGKSIEKVLIRKEQQGDLSGELYQLVTTNQIPFQFVPVEKLNRITKKNHQGAIALVSPVEYVSIEQLVPNLYEQGKVPFLLMLDGITDVRNMGAVCRTAECAGVHGVVIPSKGSAQINADAAKTSAGALNHLSVSRADKPAQTLSFLKNSGLRVVGASEKTSTSYLEIDWTDPVVLVMGSEDSGISAQLRKQCDDLVSIPVFGQIGSLNVSVAGSVIMYEIIRQRKLAQRS
jgi:23S rRNA (guanosine2251-2'-O)-methyltransferase